MNPEQMRMQLREKNQLEKVIDRTNKCYNDTFDECTRRRLIELQALYKIKFGMDYNGIGNSA